MDDYISQDLTLPLIFYMGSLAFNQLQEGKMVIEKHEPFGSSDDLERAELPGVQVAHYDELK